MAAGLTSAEARRRLAEFSGNCISSRAAHAGLSAVASAKADALTLFVAQFKSPIILILIGAAIAPLFLQPRCLCFSEAC
jgi:hypothetical protein